MASALVLPLVFAPIQAALTADATLQGLVGTRVYDNVPQTLTYPYVMLESGGESPFNTLGPAEGAKWGGSSRVDVRVVSQYRGETQGLTIASRIRAVLDGLRLDVSGYGRPMVTFETLVPIGLADVAGVKTREWVLQFAVTAHQV